MIEDEQKTAKTRDLRSSAYTSVFSSRPLSSSVFTVKVNQASQVINNISTFTVIHEYQPTHSLLCIKHIASKEV